MPDPIVVQIAGKPHGRTSAGATQEATKAREQASQPKGAPDARTVTEDAQRPTITLKTGVVVDAREAASVWRELDALLTVDPDEFRTLLALAEGRVADANPQHFESLWADAFLEMDHRTIRPVVQGVMVNSYENTSEGPVICPLRLQNESDRPIAEKALAKLDQWVRDYVRDKKNKGRSPP
jgi:hypothetical protein